MSMMLIIPVVTVNNLLLSKDMQWKLKKFNRFNDNITKQFCYTIIQFQKHRNMSGRHARKQVSCNLAAIDQLHQLISVEVCIIILVVLAISEKLLHFLLEPWILKAMLIHFNWSITTKNKPWINITTSQLLHTGTMLISVSWTTSSQLMPNVIDGWPHLLHNLA